MSLGAERVLQTYIEEEKNSHEESKVRMDSDFSAVALTARR